MIKKIPLNAYWIKLKSGVIEGYHFLEKNHSLIILAFFIGLLLLGYHIYKDYGNTYDEPMSRLTGKLYYDYLTGKNDWLIGSRFSNYGPVFELLLYATEVNLHFEQLRAVYLLRHAMTFISFYIGVIFFFFLGKKVFNNWKMGLLGCIFLLLSPRIFENAFYNTKDIPFLSLYIICLYFLIVFLEKINLRNCLLYAFASAVMVDIRNAGIILPFISIAVLCMKLKYYRKLLSRKEFVKIIALVLTYIFVTFGLIILFWPTLWNNPIDGFINTLRVMGKIQWLGPVLFMGSFIEGTEIPWYYIPVWIGITTPIIYLSFFLLGAFRTIVEIFRGPFFIYDYKRTNYCVFLLAFVGPLVAIIVFKSIVYDSWRHMFFIYGAFLITTMLGVKSFFDFIKRKISTNGSIGIVALLLFLSFANTFVFMLENHPHQGVYFNRLAGKDMQTDKMRFDMDYWGVSYYQALKYILKNDPSEKIPIFIATQSGINNLDILVASDRDRFVGVAEPEDAKYYLSDYRWHPEEYDFPNEFYSIKVGNAKIMVVYILK